MFCAEYAYRYIPRSYVIRGDLLQIDHVMCVISGPPLRHFNTGNVMPRLKCWAYTAACIIP